MHNLGSSENDHDQEETDSGDISDSDSDFDEHANETFDMMTSQSSKSSTVSRMHCRLSTLQSSGVPIATSIQTAQFWPGRFSAFAHRKQNVRDPSLLLNRLCVVGVKERALQDMDDGPQPSDEILMR